MAFYNYARVVGMTRSRNTSGPGGGLNAVKTLDVDANEAVWSRRHRSGTHAHNISPKAQRLLAGTEASFRSFQNGHGEAIRRQVKFV